MMHLVYFLLLGFSIVGFAVIPTLLVLSGGSLTWERKLAIAGVLLYFASVAWGIAELMERLL